jgi:hypothetical protein
VYIKYFQLGWLHASTGQSSRDQFCLSLSLSGRDLAGAKTRVLMTTRTTTPLHITTRRQSSCLWRIIYFAQKWSITNQVSANISLTTIIFKVSVKLWHFSFSYQSRSNTFHYFNFISIIFPDTFNPVLDYGVNNILIEYYKHENKYSSNILRSIFAPINLKCTM